MRGSEAFESCCGGFEGFKACRKRATWQFRSSLWRLGRYHGKASGTPVKVAAEGCEVLKPSKAAAEVLRVLRLAQNVPRIAVSKPNRNSLWGLGRYHGRKLLRRVVRF